MTDFSYFVGYGGNRCIWKNGTVEYYIHRIFSDSNYDKFTKFRGEFVGTFPQDEYDIGIDWHIKNISNAKSHKTFSCKIIYNFTITDCVDITNTVINEDIDIFSIDETLYNYLWLFGGQ